jgi:hypothetical protein
VGSKSRFHCISKSDILANKFNKIDTVTNFYKIKNIINDNYNNYHNNYDYILFLYVNNEIHKIVILNETEYELITNELNVIEIFVNNLSRKLYDYEIYFNGH